MNDPIIKIKLSDIMERWQIAVEDIEDFPDEFDTIETISTHILMTIFTEYQDEIHNYALRKMIEDNLGESLN